MQIRGAAEHNLQRIDVDIPHNGFVVITGPSGSGKSSLAIDTLVAESQRQYIETLSNYSRQFLNQLSRPQLDSIAGLLPTLYIDQQPTAANVRSTVGTQTEILDYLRILFARVGVASCPNCQTAISQQSLESIRDRILGWEPGRRLMILAPIVRGKQGRHEAVLETIRKQRLIRVRVDGQIHDLESVPPLKVRQQHDIEAVVDRLIVREGMDSRLFDALKLAAEMSNGSVLVLLQSADDWEEVHFSTRHACPACGQSFPEIEPRSFSFNSPYGACGECEGLGKRECFDRQLVIPDPGLPLSAALAPLATLNARQTDEWLSRLQPLAAELGTGIDSKSVPAADLWDRLWSIRTGDSTPRPVRSSRKKARRRKKTSTPTASQRLGIEELLEIEFATCRSETRLQELRHFRGPVPCRVCQGSRLGPIADAVTLGGHSLPQLSEWPLPRLSQFLHDVDAYCSPQQQSVARPLVQEIQTRLQYLVQVGLSYLTLARPSVTLSGGEFQRVRLSAALGTGLTGVCYVLDEPSIGLHQRDNNRLIETMRELNRRGNTLLVVEHDQQTMEQADLLIDIGPGAGSRGGRLVACGTAPEVCRVPESVTGQYLSGQHVIRRESDIRPVTKQTPSLHVSGAAGHNLKNVDARFPLQRLVCVTGVSGSGKSTLVNQTLLPAVARELGLHRGRPAPLTALRGADSIQQLIEVNQSPVGRSPRGCLATYSGVLTEIRKLFAASRDARRLGFDASRFSFNNAAGRCEVCEGSGSIRLEMKFLPDVNVVCTGCRGRRFNAQTLRARYNGKSIADVLDLEVAEALQFFAAVSRIATTLSCFVDVGLGYLALGQPTTTLSGGEAQRLKLATELSRSAQGHTLYLLDEPTTGLHFADLQRLILVLDQLVSQGHSVIVIEHNLDLIRCADWIIDLGPDGGDAGGEIIACGTPEQVAQSARSHTGQFLRQQLHRS